MTQKKQEMHKTQNRDDTTDRVWTEIIETLQWVLSRKSISIRRLLLSDEDGDGVRHYY